MVIQKAHVTAKAAENPESVALTLVEDETGWTYSVDGVTGGPFYLAWREPTPEKASKTLLESFAPSDFAVEVVEER